jgi:hypothetical protein
MVRAESLSRFNGTSNVLREFKNEKAPKENLAPLGAFIQDPAGKSIS